MARQIGLGIKLNVPVQVVELDVHNQRFRRTRVIGARKNGARTNAANLYSEAGWPLHYPVYEQPDDETIAAVEAEIQQIEREKQDALMALSERRRLALARLTRIPSDKLSDIQAWADARNAEVQCQP